MAYLFNPKRLPLLGIIYILQIVKPGKVISLTVYVYSLS